MGEAGARLAGRRSGPGGARRRCNGGDRKSTRLNSSHSQISYAVFCLKKKNLITLCMASLGTVRHLRRFDRVVIDSLLILSQMLRNLIGLSVRRPLLSGNVHISWSVTR